MNKQQVRELQDAPTTVAAKGALAAMAEEDRNARVAALRVIQSVAGRDDFTSAAQTACLEAVLKALSDSKRRVRWNASKCAGLFMDHPDILARIQAIAEDETEKRKIRFTALYQLSDARVLPEPAMDALRLMSDVPKYRQHILLILLRAEMSESVKELLQEYVRNGTREEALLATRALCGYQVVHIQSLDKDARKRLTLEDQAMSSLTWWWVKRE